MNETINKELVIASENGQLEDVRSLLDKGADPNASGPNSRALHCAAFNGHLKVVDVLLNKGADTNLKDNQGFYPLHLAASKGETAIGKLLISGGAEIECLTEKKGSPLHVASASNYPLFVELLVKKKANIEAADFEGKTPLIVAAESGASKSFKKLVSKGANLDTQDENGNSPIIHSLYNLYRSRINSWSSVGTNSGTTVKYEIVKGCFRYYNPFIEGSEDLGKILSIKDQQYCASQSWGKQEHLQYLSAFDDIKLLVKKGANITHKNNLGQTVMSIACHSGESKLIELFSKKGVSFKNVEKGGMTPLHKVAGSGRIDGLITFFKLAKKEEYDINALDEYGFTAAHFLADIGGHPKMAKLLIDNGVDLTIGSTKDRGTGMPVGVKASEVALHWNDAAMAELLKTDN